MLLDELFEPSRKLYHVTLTRHVPAILKRGILPMQTSNWVQAGSGKRYGSGEIFAFDDRRDAVRWAAKWDWELNKEMGSGKISIVEFESPDDWGVDTADPLSQAGSHGQWRKRQAHVPSSDIRDSYPVTPELIRKSMSLGENYNPKVFTRGFEQDRDHGRYRLVARVGRMPYSPDRPAMRSDQFRVEAYRGRSLVGWVNFEAVDDHLEAVDLVVEPQHRRRGIATAMYQFARDLGNDIRPSSKQTAMGKQFWATKSPVEEEQLDELSFLGSQCTKDCSGHRAGYDWFKQNGRDPASWSPSFNKGAALAKAGK